MPGLVNLLREGEDISELMKLSPEQLLLRWVNYQLEKVSCHQISCCSDGVNYQLEKVSVTRSVAAPMGSTSSWKR